MKPTQYKSSSQSGFTLVELILVMAIFIVILMIASESFKKILTQSSKLFKREESNIEGMIGLEVMKHDLEQMGFGLPWGFSMGNPPASGSVPPSNLVNSTITYAEAVDALGSGLNDMPSNVPRAFAAFAGIGAFTSDYIGVRASTVGGSKAAQRWTYIPFHNLSTSTGRESRPVTFAANNPTVGDKVIMINSNFNDPDNMDHRLIVNPNDTTKFNINYDTSTAMDSNFLPTDDQQTYMVYGIDDVTTYTNLRMPFNRADFFIKVPGGVASADGSTDGTLPAYCAPLTGVLYKATVNQKDGNYNYIPLLDCVADMQVVLGWDSSDGGKAGSVNTYSSLPQNGSGIVANLTTTDPLGASGVRLAMQFRSGDPNVPSGWLNDAKGLREHLKIVKIYILAQDGKIDPSYTTPSNTISVGDLQENGGLAPVKNYTLTEPQTHYRWKLYRIIVHPKNLVSNQR